MITGLRTAACKKFAASHAGLVYVKNLLFPGDLVLKKRDAIGKAGLLGLLREVSSNWAASTSSRTASCQHLLEDRSLYPRSGKNWRRSEATAVIIRGSLLSPQAWPVRIPTGRRRQAQGSLLWQVKVFFPVVSSQPWLSRATSAHADHNNKTVCGVPTVGLTIVTGRGACEKAELCPVERNLLIKKVGSRFLFPLF